ncbi:MAG TPA: efflux RND transporter periplasmic adaptor subunit, partial [Mariniphaga sp.]|nr:efflux RND transporter periplasmic adaptor subunit [Mariniphaga sp.]
NALDAATIKAPRNGMVMYARNRYRRKIRVGDNVSQWNPAIASLPDLSVLISETFVEEIQITKLQEGDSVSITVDAIPGKVYSGKVSKIANIGQELSGFDSKVFGVTIDIYNSDPALRPAMTSNNNIFINNMRDVLTIPRDGLFAENGKNFVYLKKAGVVYKQPVTIGFENETDYVITSGLKEDDKILLNLPDKDTEIQEVIASN